MSRAEAETADADFGDLIGRWLLEMPRIGENHKLAACFSSVGDLPSQWRSCARDGYAFAFDVAALEALTIPSDYILVACLYKRIEHEALCRTAVRDTISVYRRSVARGQTHDAAAMHAKHLFEILISDLMPQIEHEVFRDACEYRLVSTTPLKFRPGDHLRSRSRHGLEIPYEAVSFRAKGGNSALREVMIAPGADYELAKADLESVLDGAGHPNVEITRSAIAPLF